MSAAGFLSFVEDAPSVIDEANLEKDDYLSALFTVLSINSDEWEVASKALVTHFLLKANKEDQVWRVALERELQQTAHRQQLFREDSFFMRVIQTYLRFTTLHYCAKVLTIPKMVATSDSSIGQVILKNLAKLPVPKPVQRVLNALKVGIEERFASSMRKLSNREVGLPERMALNFFFLHYLTPAIANPYKLGLAPSRLTVAELKAGARVARWIQTEMNSWGTVECKNPKLLKAFCDGVFETTSSVSRRMAPDLLDNEVTSARAEQLKELMRRYDVATTKLSATNDSAEKAAILKEEFGSSARVQLLATKAGPSALHGSGKQHCQYCQVPDEWEIFSVQGEDTCAAYFQQLRVSRQTGALSLMGDRLVMVPARALGSVLRKVWSNLKGESSDFSHLMYRMGRAVGDQEARAFQNRVGEKLSVKELTIACLPYLSLIGWAQFAVDEKNSDMDTTPVELSLQATYSFEAFSESRKEGSVNQRCVCHLVRGFLAGWVSVTSGPVECVEVMCSSGEACCFFLATPSIVSLNRAHLMKQRKSKHSAETGTSLSKTSLEPGVRDALWRAIVPGDRLRDGLIKAHTSSTEAYPTSGTDYRALAYLKENPVWALVSDATQAGLWVQGRRVVLLNTTLITAAIEEEVRSVSESDAGTNELLADGWFHAMGYCMGYEGGALLQANEAITASYAMHFAALPSFLAFFGLGRATVSSASLFTPKSNEFCAVISVGNTWESVLNMGDTCTCAYTAGALAGFCNRIRGSNDLACVETMCLIGASGSCTFLVAHSSTIMAMARATLAGAEMGEEGMDSILRGVDLDSTATPSSSSRKSRMAQSLSSGNLRASPFSFVGAKKRISFSSSRSIDVLASADSVG